MSQEASVQLINFIVQIVLARLLAPQDFGLIAMLTVFISIGNMLIDGGLTSSLIRTKELDDDDYSTVFFINFAGSLFIYLLIFFSAPYIASFYEKPLLLNVIRVYTFSLIIRSLMAVQITKLTKEMKFKKQMSLQLPSVLLGGTLGVLLAYMDYGVWSLVWMTICQTSVLTISYWLKSGWYPKLIFNTEKMKYHFNFGYKLTLVGLMNVAYKDIYNVLIGKYFTAHQLGFYNQAYTLAMFPVQQLNKALNKVTYPLFASISENNTKLKDVYKQIIQQVIFLVAPIMLCLAIVAEPLFVVVLTEKWLPGAVFFQIFCVSAIFYPLTIFNTNILKAKGRSGLIFKITFVKFLFLIPIVFLLIRIELIYLAFFQAFAVVLSFIINAEFSGRMINYGVIHQLRDLLSILCIGFLTALLVIWVDSVFFLDLTNLTRIMITGFVFAFVYLALIFIFKKSMLIQLSVLVKGFRNKRL